MIKTIDIKNFGLFKDYIWNSEIGVDETFQKVNIIYGRNYSGKTTLSRIFRCVENGALHENYNNAEFTLSSDGGTITHANLEYSKKIRVYNSDFVKDNLSWLRDEKNGEIKPFALLGNENTVVQAKINEIDKELGIFKEADGDYPEGSLYSQEQKKKEEKNSASREHIQRETELNNALTQKANRDIKSNPNFVKQGTTYNVNYIKRDIDDIIDNNLECALNEDEIANKKAIIKEEAKGTITRLLGLNLNFLELISKTKDLIAKEVTLSKTIKELIENDVLQAWVNQGRNLHSEQTSCAFCGSIITLERRKELDEHFSKESSDLEREINSLLGILSNKRELVNNYLTNNNIGQEKFYVGLKGNFSSTTDEWNYAVKVQNDQISLLEGKLQERLRNIFKPVSDADFTDIELNAIDFESIINKLNLLIDDNQNKTNTIEVDKETARKVLRYNYIKGFLEDIDYNSKLKTIEEAQKKSTRLFAEYEKLNKKISELVSEKTTLEKQLKDESRAAEKINKHLADFFGHDGLKLEPIETQLDGQKQTRFIIKRGDEDANNLSEGECSLIAFCYFIAKIEDELKNADAKDNLIIYIDDPISSLDNNHIFFMYGLIESMIVMDKNFKQLFISTHNLEFLKHLTNLNGYKNTSKNVNHFLIEKRKRDNEFRSFLRTMPRYLRVNISEYAYLFDQIHQLADQDKSIDEKIVYYENNHTLLYNMGNNMRKFLECYMSYRYPGIDSPLHNLNLLFEDAIPRQINRLINEYSHLVWGVRGTLPIDVPEAEEIAKLIINAIKKDDTKHYYSLLKCTSLEPIA